MVQSQIPRINEARPIRTGLANFDTWEVMS